MQSSRPPARRRATLASVAASGAAVALAGAGLLFAPAAQAATHQFQGTWKFVGDCTPTSYGTLSVAPAGPFKVAISGQGNTGLITITWNADIAPQQWVQVNWTGPAPSRKPAQDCRLVTANGHASLTVDGEQVAHFSNQVSVGGATGSLSGVWIPTVVTPTPTPTETTPSTTEPTSTEPTETMPATTEPTTTEPTVDPTETTPSTTEPTSTESTTTTEPTETTPAATEPSTTEPSMTEPTVDPTETTPTTTEPSTTEPSTTEPTTTEPTATATPTSPTGVVSPTSTTAPVDPTPSSPTEVAPTTTAAPTEPSVTSTDGGSVVETAPSGVEVGGVFVSRGPNGTVGIAMPTREVAPEDEASQQKAGNASPSEPAGAESSAPLAATGVSTTTTALAWLGLGALGAGAALLMGLRRRRA